MLEYVENDRYRGSWINRAAENFVLQMGGFYSHTKRVPIDDRQHARRRFVRHRRRRAGGRESRPLEHGRHRVAGPVRPAAGGTNQDSGTSSFFVNLTSNTFLDADFTVFAAIPDMTTINKIMALTQIDLTADPDFGAGDGNLAFSDVPLEDNGFQVFIKRTFVINDTLAVAQARAGIESVMAASLAGGGAGGGGSSANSAALNPIAAPEPASGLLIVLGIVTLALRRRR